MLGVRHAVVSDDAAVPAEQARGVDEVIASVAGRTWPRIGRGL